MTTNESILNDVKLHLGLEPDDTAFDVQIIDSINTAFMVLWQLGVGPVYTVTDANDKWSDYKTDAEDLAAIKTDVYMRVKMIFDPPQNGTLMQAMKDQIAEYEWRLNAACDPRDTFDEEETDGK